MDPCPGPLERQQGSERRRHRAAGWDDLPWYTIVGVVGDVKQQSRQATVQNAVYLTPRQWYFADRTFWFVVRTERDAQLAFTIKQAADGHGCAHPGK